MSTHDGIPVLLGGVPNRGQDLAASIVFSIAYGCLLVPATWRLAAKSSRSLILIRPFIFIFTQAAAYALRAVIANGNSAVRIYVASEVLLLAGFTLICEPIPSLLRRVNGKKKERDGASHMSHRLAERIILIVLALAISVALILGIVAATSIKLDLSADRLAVIARYREASSALVIGAMVGAAIIAISIVRAGLLSSRAVVWTVFQTVLIMTSAAYKLASTIHPGGNFSAPAKAVFYVLNGLVAWIVTLPFFAVNLNDYFIDPDAPRISTPETGDSTWELSSIPVVPKASRRV